jgi:hypothetical protein
VTLCARGNDDCIDALVEHVFRGRCRRRAERGGHLGCSNRVRVGQEDRDAVELAQRLSVKSADPADTDDPDTEWRGNRHGHAYSR